MFITFEGLDGSGKTTIVDKLRDFLAQNYSHLSFVFTREPGGCGLKEAEKIREVILDKENEIDPMSEAVLFAASRRLHLEKIIWPSLKEGKIVICDRYIDSSIAYQGAGKQIGVEKVRALNEIVIENTYPNATFLFDISAQEARKRLLAKTNHSDDRMEMNKIDFFTRTYDAYHDLAKQEPNRYYIIDATKSVEEVFEQVKIEIIKLLNNK
ncbi:dTMP kinase [Mycoplasma procyoni]|uniref:dTMP kinase n=1 Tax=Mycoplasma procyoni TaxID=568784 RepID=UPI00197C8DB1|nr:dTMP kinase [Mycoplasma procyoni]MBN3534588.1 dTMP kinase [Mycoplasma procyoni]